MNLWWAELLLASLRDAGAGELVVSPGSRSTPLVLAAARLGLPCHVLIDERVAGFFALGQGRVTGRPAVLVCTSGSAGAHYLPAVIEAAEARVPLLVVTADRPPELHGCAAPQTVDQHHLYGRFARGFVDLGMPEAEMAALRGVRRRAAQLVALALGPEPGPVHINVPARKPLEPAAAPDRADAEADRRIAALVSAVRSEPIARAPAAVSAPPAAAIAELAAALRQARRGLLVAGPAGPGSAAEREAVIALAEVSGLPLLAEATSGLRWTGAAPPAGLVEPFDLLLRSARGGELGAPDLIVQLGAPPVSSAWAALRERARAGCRVVALAPHGWSDPHGGAELLIRADLAEVAGQLAAALRGAPPVGDDEERAGARLAWRERWSAAARDVRAAMDRSIAARGGEAGPLAEHAAARAAVDALPDGALLVVGNSLPVRTVDAACPAGPRRLDVLCQRGASGIDGLVAGAAGAASAARRPTLLLLGDVSFAHDLSGLAAARLAGAPLAILVLDNGGGRIFEQLPVARAPGGAEVLERFFLTPPGLDLAAAAAAFDVRFQRAASAAAVGAAVEQALGGPGPSLIHVPVAPHGARELEAAVLARLEQAP